MFRFTTASLALILVCALTNRASAADPDFKSLEAPRTSAPQIVFANLPKANYSPTILPDLYLPSPRANVTPTATIPRPGAELNNTVAIGRSSSITIGGLGSMSQPTTSFDLGFNSFANMSTSSAGQSAPLGSSLSDKLILTLPSLRDAGLGLGASQYVPPMRYLDDGHQFLNR
jgi:hypothetical protein